MRIKSKAAIAFMAASTLILAGCAGAGSNDGGKDGVDEADIPNVAFDDREASIDVGYPEPEEGDYSIAFLVPVDGNEAFEAMEKSARQTAEALGGTLTAFNAGGSVDTQVGQFEQVIAQDFDAVIVSDLDPASLTPITARAKAADIKLLSVNLDPTGDEIGNYDTQILLGNAQMAYELATQMAKTVPAGSKIGTIDFAVQVPGIVAFMKKLKEYTEAYGLEVVGNASNPSDDIAGGEVAGTELLNNNPDLDAIMGYNDPSAIGAAAAARSLGQRDLTISGSNGGSDGFEAVRSGRIAFTVQASYVPLGKYAVWGLYNLIQGKEVPVTVVTEPPSIVTSDNIDSVKTWDEQLEGAE